jgi:hypothetical protein
MTYEDIKIGQVFTFMNDELLGVFLLTWVDHERDHRYVTYKKLWLWHVDPGVSGRQSTGGAPWECAWTHELLA